MLTLLEPLVKALAARVTPLDTCAIKALLEVKTLIVNESVVFILFGLRIVLKVTILVLDADVVDVVPGIFTTDAVFVWKLVPVVKSPIPKRNKNFSESTLKALNASSQV